MTNELVTIPSNDSNPYAIMPVMDVRGAAQRRQALIDYTAAMMVKGRDFGTIPGAGPKPTLLKPGAEKLASLFGLYPDFDPVTQEMDWTGENHDGEAFFYIQYRCTLYRGDTRVGQGVGSCNSWEKKYRLRQGVRNPNPADLVNTIDKMAQKRALVAAVLIAVNASEFFTQDIEDYSDIVDGDWQPAPAQAQPKQAPPKTKPATPPADTLLYEDGSFVADDPRTYAIYNDYVQAHGGKAPANKFNLQAWYKKQNGNSTATVAETQPAQPADQSLLFDGMEQEAQAGAFTE